MTESRSLDDIEKELKHGQLTQRQRAILENELWEGMKTVGNDRGKTLSELLDVPAYHIEQRLMLLRAGQMAEPLWERLEGDMTLHMAVELVRKAKAGGSTVQEVLESYDTAARLPGGSRRLAGGKVAVVKAKILEAEAEVPKVEAPKGIRSFKHHLRGLLTTFVNDELADQPEAVRKELADDFFFGLRVLMDDMQTVLSRRRKESKDEKTVMQHRTIRVLKDACSVLDVDVDKLGRFNMNEAQRKFRKLAATFHPDRNSNPDVVKQYHAVVEAWNVIKEFEHG